MSATPTILRDFEGKPFITLLFDGRPVWAARHVGTHLGYRNNGKQLSNKILGEWAEDFEEGTDYTIATGETLSNLWAATIPYDGSARKGGRGLLILFEPGMDKVIERSGRPVARKLRRFLTDEVLPEVARRLQPVTEIVERRTRNEGTRTALSHAVMVISRLKKPPRPGLRDARERRLALIADTRERWVALCERKLKLNALYRALDSLGEALPDEVRVGLEMEAVEVATGLHFDDIKPWPKASTSRLAEAVAKIEELTRRARAARGQ